jgi:hypothetical protein
VSFVCKVLVEFSTEVPGFDFVRKLIFLLLLILWICLNGLYSLGSILVRSIHLEIYPFVADLFIHLF